MGSFRKSVISFFAFSFVIFSCTDVFGAVPAIIGQDDGGVGNSPVSFNMGESSEMSQGHRVHVNAATGNLALKHTDLVVPTKGKDIVISRTYNSFRHLHGVEKGLELSAVLGGGASFTITVKAGVAWINGERVKTSETVQGISTFLDNEYRRVYAVNDNGQGSIEIRKTSTDASNKLYLGTVSYRDGHDGDPDTVTVNAADNPLGKNAKEYIEDGNLGTGGKWRFNFESYAYRDRYQVSTSSYVNHMTFLAGEGTTTFIKTDEISYPDPVVGQTEKRGYLSCEFIAPAEDGVFATPTYTSDEGQTVYTRHNRFECETLDGEVHIYKGIQVYNSSNVYRDDAVLSEVIDASGNRLVYEWKDGSANDGSWFPSLFEEGSFSGYFGFKRNIYLNRIYDDNDYNGPDSVQVKFNYNAAEGISSIVVTDAQGNNPEMVAQYEHEIITIPPEYFWDEETYELGNLTGYTDFHGRHFDYVYSDADDENTFLTGITDPAGGVLSISYWDPSFKVFRVESPKYSDGNTGGFVTPPEVIFLSGSLCEQYTYDWEMRETYRALPEENSIAVFKWESDIKDNSNILEDRRIIKKEIHSLSNWLSNNPVTTTTWSYNADTVMVLSETDGNGYTTSFEYNGKRQLTRKAYPDGSDEVFTYSTDGYDNLETKKDPKGNIVSYDYTDPNNPYLLTRISYKVDDIQHLKTFEYNNNGLLETETDSGGNTITYSDYDGQGQLRKKGYSRTVEGSPVSLEEEFVHDMFGRLLSQKDENGHTVSYAYDESRYLSRRSENLEVNGIVMPVVEDYDYDDLGSLIQVTDYEEGITKYGYDADGNMISIWKGNGSGAGYSVNRLEYDSTGKVIKKLTAAGTAASPGWHTTELQRNAAGWITAIVEKAVATDVGVRDVTTTFSYDLAGNMKEKILPSVDGQDNVWAYDYSNMNRLIGVKEPGAALENNHYVKTSYSFDPNGNLIGFTDPKGHSASFTYNEINRVSSVIQPDRDSKYFLYDGEGRVVHSVEKTGDPFLNGIAYVDGGTQYTSTNLRIGYLSSWGVVYNQSVARRIDVGYQQTLAFDHIRVFVHTLANPSGNWTVSVQSEEGTFLSKRPSGTLIKRDDGSDAVATVAAPVDAQEWFEIDIGQGSTITQEDDFWIVFQRSENDSTGYWNLGYQGYDNYPTHPSAYNKTGSSWTTQAFDVGIQLVDTDQITSRNRYFYNSEGSLSTVSLADGQTLSFLYNERGQVKEAVRYSATGTRVANEYDFYPESGWMKSRNTNIDNGAGLTLGYQYNALGQLSLLDHPGNEIDPVYYNYTADGFHRLAGIVGYVDDIDYDLGGRPVGYLFANGFTETYERDSLGRPSSYAIHDPAAGVNRFLEAYIWNARGNLASREWESRAVSGTYLDGDADIMSYDPNDRLWSVESGSHMSYFYEYDGSGNQLWDPLAGPGQLPSIQYDPCNRVVRRDLVNGDYQEFGWTEPDGRKRGNLSIKTLKDSTGQILSTDAAYHWTEDNLLTKVVRSQGVFVDYLYDAGGDRIYRMGPEGDTFYLFNGLDVSYEEEQGIEGTTKRYYIHGLGRQIAVVEVAGSQAGGGLWATAWDASTVSGDGLWGDYTAAGRNSRMIVRAVDTVAEGGKVRLTFKGHSTKAGQITGASIGPKKAGSDPWDFASAPVNITFNGGNDSGTIPAGGVLVSDEINFNFNEDTDYLVAVYSTDGDMGYLDMSSASYRKDGLGYDDSMMVSPSAYYSSASYIEYLSKIEIYAATGGGGMSTCFYHTDYLGSVRMITDESAAVVWQKRYEPFGGEEEQSGSINNDYQFTGKGWDAEAGLYYFNARWYDPDVGRFISEDPLWGNVKDPQSLNRFAYGRNNPFRYVDRAGLWSADYNEETGEFELSDDSDAIYSDSDYSLDHDSDYDLGNYGDNNDNGGENGYAALGSGFSIVPLVGFEVSGGYFWDDLTGESGFFICSGVGIGFNVSGDFFIGALKRLPKGHYFGTNVVLGPFSASSFGEDIKMDGNDMFNDIQNDNDTTGGVGPGFPIGGSVSSGKCHTFFHRPPRNFDPRFRISY